MIRSDNIWLLFLFFQLGCAILTEFDYPDLIIKNISQLITQAPEGVNNSKPRIRHDLQKLGIIENGAIAILNDKIISVGTTGEVLSEVDVSHNTLELTGTNKTVMPGFVDPHTHLIFAGSRETELTLKLEGKTYMEILQSGGGILKTVVETRQASLNDLVYQGLTRLITMLSYGTTTIEAKSGYGLETQAELKSLEAIKILNQKDVPPGANGT